MIGSISPGHVIDVHSVIKTCYRFQISQCDNYRVLPQDTLSSLAKGFRSTGLLYNLWIVNSWLAKMRSPETYVKLMTRPMNTELVLLY